ncbi:MAG: ABC-type transport auxiliary lipoprotein family protein [Chthoniobacterales bacterium]
MLLIRFQRTLLCTLLAVAAVMMPACSFMAARTSAQTFLLDPGVPPRAAKQINGSVAVSFVDVSSPYSMGNFQYRLTESDWEVDPYNRFLSSPQEMMTRVIRTWLEKSNAFSTVVMPASGAVADFQVECEVTSLLVDFRDAGNPEAVMAMEFRVMRSVKNAPSEVALRKAFSSRAPVHARTPEAFVQAWNVALRENMISFSAALKAI